VQPDKIHSGPDEKPSWAGFAPRAVVWRALGYQTASTVFDAIVATLPIGESVAAPLKNDCLAPTQERRIRCWAVHTACTCFQLFGIKYTRNRAQPTNYGRSGQITARGPHAACETISWCPPALAETPTHVEYIYETFAILGFAFTILGIVMKKARIKPF